MEVECTLEERAELGIPEGLIRYSTGIEDLEDLIEDYALRLTGSKNAKALSARRKD